MIIVGFDQAVVGIGWAHGEPGSVPTRGWQELPDYGNNTARLGKYVRQWAIQFLKSIGAERVYFEQITARKHGFDMQVFRKQCKVADAIETSAEMIGLEDHAYEVMIGDWRREFHHGISPQKHPVLSATELWKDMAIKECAARNWWTENHNIAEACGIWDFGCKCEDTVYRSRAKRAKRRAEHEADEARRAAL